MMVEALRSTMRTMLDGCPTSRPAVLRRCSDPDWLFATDLPLVTGAPDVEAFMNKAQAATWSLLHHDGWLWLDHDVLPPILPCPDVRVSGEPGCCISLLRRHPGGASTQAERRVLLKAEEEPAALQRLWRSWHAEWAARLRLGQPLPADLLPWLCYLAQVVD